MGRSKAASGKLSKSSTKTCIHGVRGCWKKEGISISSFSSYMSHIAFLYFCILIFVTKRITLNLCVPIGQALYSLLCSSVVYFFQTRLLGLWPSISSASCWALNCCAGVNTTSCQLQDCFSGWTFSLHPMHKHARHHTYRCEYSRSKKSARQSTQLPSTPRRLCDNPEGRTAVFPSTLLSPLLLNGQFLQYLQVAQGLSAMVEK